MIDRADLTLLVAVVVIMEISTLLVKRSARLYDTSAQRYKLFKVRDDLVYLVATGKLREDDFVFQSFYKAVNHVVNTVNHINLSSFLAALMEARKKGLDPAEQEKLDRINRELKRKDKEVVTVVHGFYRTITEILVENSWILRCLIRSETLRRILRWLSGAVQSGGRYRSAYRFYREYSEALQAV